MRRITSGIDVSSHQGAVDWKKVKQSGIDFAVLRASFGYLKTDKTFEDNLEGCVKNGIPFGVYHYSYALDFATAKAEAENLLSAIGNASPQLPVFLDLEEKSQTELSAEKQFEIIDAFLDTVEAAGFEGGIYSFKNALEKLRKYDAERLEKRWVWVAQWNSRPTYAGRFDIWQKSSAGSVSGISTAVDLNVCYTDFLSEGDGEIHAEVTRLKSRLSEIAKLATI